MISYTFEFQYGMNKVINANNFMKLVFCNHTKAPALYLSMFKKNDCINLLTLNQLWLDNGHTKLYLF